MLALALTATVLAFSGYLAAARLAHPGGALARALVTLLVAPAIPIAAVQLCGAVGAVRAAPVVALTLALAALVGAWGARGVGTEGVLAALRWDRAAPARLLRESLREAEPAMLAVPLAAFALGVSALIAVRLPSWSWDCVWYHVPSTNFVVQHESTAWVDTNVWYVNGYPRAIELLSAFCDLLTGDSSLDDVPQLPFGLLGALGVAAFARRFEASAPLSAGVGALFLCLPAVFLQLHTTHADVAAGSLFIVGAYFLTAPSFATGPRLAAVLAFALYAGTKVTGLFHLMLVLPLVAARFVAGVRRDRRWSELLVALALFGLFAAPTYVRNALREGNPLWPARIELPFGVVLPGPIAESQIAGTPAFFRAPGAFTRMVETWFTPATNHWPDLREGPFGVLFPYLLLPTLLLFALGVPFGKRRLQKLGVVALAVVAVLVPAAWWGRFVLALPAAALVAFAVSVRALPFAFVRRLATLTAVGLALYGYVQAYPGYHVVPTPFASAAQREDDERELRAHADWLWPPEWVSLRERELAAGTVIAHDQHLPFLSELWRYDLRNRVVFTPHRGDDAEFLSRVRALRPKWISVGRRSASERALRTLPAGSVELLFHVRRTSSVMYRLTLHPSEGRLR